jgi:hypothetical protein
MISSLQSDSVDGEGWLTKRAVSLLLLIALIPMFTGCRTWGQPEEIPPDEFLATTALDADENRIVGVITTDGDEVAFSQEPVGANVRGDTIYGYVGSEPYQVAFSDVERVQVSWRETNVLAVVGIAAAALLVVGAIAVATKESCPFIYSWNGEQWVFDAEPYGGATTKGLERADFSELENLVAVDGEYRLRITNEVNESQYTNLLELWAVHHPAGTQVVADEFGTLYTMRQPASASSAVDASGRDLLPWLEATDARVWEHDAVPTPTGDLRQDLILTFPKPKGATEARLIANVATGAWGSHMIRELYEMRGTGLDAFYEAVDTSPEAQQELFFWNLREELFTLQIRVEEPTGWEVRGLLPGGGPFISEDRAVPLDISRVEGDKVRIRIRPPVGFWGLNSFQMDFSSEEPVQVEQLALTVARTSDGENVLPNLTAVDDSYYAMPEPGNWAELRFPAVDPPQGMEQTFILSTQGYYRLHLEANQTPNAAAIREIETVPGAPVRMAVERYAAALAAAGEGGGLER